MLSEESDESDTFKEFKQFIEIGRGLYRARSLSNDSLKMIDRHSDKLFDMLEEINPVQITGAIRILIFNLVDQVLARWAYSCADLVSKLENAKPVQTSRLLNCPAATIR
jgi:hypothetical protein